MTTTPACPTCGAELRLKRDGVLDAWLCPAGHGKGFTLTEAYERIDDDEVQAIWQQARESAPGTRACPLCGETMVAMTVAPTVGGDATLPLDVCLRDELLWFDAGELDAVPVRSGDDDDNVADLADDARIAEITRQFGVELTAGWSS
jgi:Zn-finger nucleic acid-binding protein